ncbi:MAG: DNA-deoxyinosine glycosylase [Firmicutes bacterium]|nr:DNA-deoxyinosine glycosylase [Bacillota bacterium]MBQ9604586.1 DNA-deoxyinosine glycosylase [Bacillota bacterium]
MKEYTHIKHGFEPVFSDTSKILILGTLPSVKSREANFYYGHPQNRFWRVLAAVYNAETPQSIAEKKGFLLANDIAVWDVIDECDIIGSSDSSIKNVVPADIAALLAKTRIERIYANGGTAKRLYDKYQKPLCKKEALLLPSTSPANAAWSVERLVEAWSAVRKM